MQKSKITITSTLIKRKKEWEAIAKEKDAHKVEPDWNKIRPKIKTRISALYCKIVRENSLIISSLYLLYLNFTNTCCIDYSRRID